MQPAAPPAFSGAALSRNDWIVIAALTLCGLALRIAMAQGALWLDEVWSAMQAHWAATPVGVFIGINHDNNHHLNSLWMQAVGIDAPPVLQRALAIAAGTLTIPAAAVLCGREGRTAGVLAAALVAVLPFYAFYGSEARGYAPMMLALLIVMIRTDRWLHGEEEPPATSLALWSVLGVLSQLTMVIGLAVVGGWVLVTLWRRDGVFGAIRGAWRAFGGAAVAVVGVIGAILWVAEVNSGGMRFGALVPFTYDTFVIGIAALCAWCFAIPVGPVWPIAAVLALLAAGLWLGVGRVSFHLLAMIGFPLVVLIVQPANAVQSRYYFVVAISALILLAEGGARAIAAGGWWRVAAIGLCAVVLAGSVAEDVRLIRNQRGDPGAAIRAMRALAPNGADVLVERESTAPVVAVAAMTEHYHLRTTRAPCPAPRFLFTDRYNHEQFPGPQRRCGRDYVPVASARAYGMANFHWRLDERR